jgi:hypothetical protein
MESSKQVAGLLGQEDQPIATLFSYTRDQCTEKKVLCIPALIWFNISDLCVKPLEKSPM